MPPYSWDSVMINSVFSASGAILSLDIFQTVSHITS
jgi:hypothetical protein